jgi:hypothetical protein
MEDNTKLLGSEELNKDNRPVTSNFAKSLRDSAAKYSKTDDPTIRSFTKQGRFDPKYDAGLAPGINESQNRNFNQGAGEMMGHMLVQGLKGETFWGSVEGVGYLAGILGEVIDPVKEGSLKFDTWLSEYARKAKEAVKEDYPIFEAKPGEYNPGDFAYWMTNGASAFSTLSLIIPATGTIKGIGYLAKGIKALNAMKEIKIGKDVLDASGKVVKAAVTIGGVGEIVGSAALSRHMESMMEAAGTYDTVYNRLRNQENPDTKVPFTDQEAKLHAGKAAAGTYNWNWLAMATDIPQYALMLRGPKFAKLAAKSKAKEYLAKIGTTAGVMASEGLEETYQHNVQEEFTRQAFLDAKLEPDSPLDFIDRVLVNSTTGEGKTSFMVGALAGGGQHAIAGPAMRKFAKLVDNWTKDKPTTPEEEAAQEKMKEQITKFNRVLGYSSLLLNASENHDDQSFNFIKGLSHLDISLENIKAGGLDVELEKVDTLIAEDVAGLNGITDPTVIKAEGELIKKDLRDLDKIYGETRKSYAHIKGSNKGSIIDEIARNTFMMGVIKRNIAKYKSDMAEASKDYTETLNESTSKLREHKEDILAFQLYKKVLEGEIAGNPKMDEVSKKDKEKDLTWVQGELNKLNKALEGLEKKEDVTKYESRVTFPLGKYQLYRTERNKTKLSNKLNSYNNEKVIKKMDDTITEVKVVKEQQKKAAQTLDESEDRAAPTKPVNVRKNTDWGNPDEVFKTLDGLFTEINKDATIVSEVPGVFGTTITTRNYPHNNKLIDDLIESIDAAVTRETASKLLGDAYPKVGATEAVGLPTEVQPGVPGEPWGLIKGNPLSTVAAIKGVFDGDFGTGPEIDKIKSAISGVIDGTASVGEESEEVEETSTKGSTEGEAAAPEKETKSKKKKGRQGRIEQPIVKQSALHNGPQEQATTHEPVLRTIFGEGWEYVNSPEGLQEGEQIRLYVPDPNIISEEDLNKLPERSRDAAIAKAKNLSAYYRENVITADNIPIYIQAKIKGRWVDMGQLRSKEWMEKNYTPEDAKTLNKKGVGPLQLMAIRENLFAKQNKPLKSRITKKRDGDLKTVNGKVQRLSSRSENIPYYQDRIILAGWNGLGYEITNETEVAEDMGSWNRGELEGQAEAHKAKAHLIVKDIDGSPRPIVLDTKRMGSVEGAIPAMIQIIKDIRDNKSDKNKVKALKKRMEDITYTGRASFDDAGSRGFKIDSRHGVYYASPGVEAKEAAHIKWDELDARIPELENFFEKKLMQFSHEKINKKTSYTNPITGEDAGTYNDYVLDVITDTNWTGNYQHGKFSFEDPLGTIESVQSKKEKESRLDDEASTPEKKIVPPARKRGSKIVPATGKDRSTKKPIATPKAPQTEESPFREDNDNVGFEVPEAIRDDIWNYFVDNNTVPLGILTSIANKVINNEVLSTRELAIRAKKSQAIDAILNKKAPKAMLVPESELPSAENPFPNVKVMDRKQQVAWFKKHFPNTPIEVMEGLISVSAFGGNKAYGIFRDAAVYVYKNAKEGAVYHEAFHVIFNMFTDNKQKVALMKGAQSLWGTNGKELSLEEDLAEGFRHFQLNQKYLGKTIPKYGAIRRFFNKIIAFVKTYLNRPLTIEEFFNNIEGNTYDANKLGELKNFKGERTMLVIDGFTAVEQRRRVTTIANMVWEKIKADIEEGVIEELEDADLRLYFDGVLEDLEDTLVTVDLDADQVLGIQKMVDNFDALQNHVLDYYENFGFITKNQDALDFEDEMEDIKTNIGDQNDLFDIPHFQLSRKEKANPLVTRYLAFLEIPGKPGQDDLGFQKVVNFHQTWNDIAIITADSASFEEMVGKLEAMLDKKPELNDLLYDLTEGTDEQFKSAFYSTFSNHRMRFHSMNTSGKSTTMYMTNRKNINQTIQNEWENNFNNSKYAVMENGVYKANKQELKKVLVQLETFATNLFNKGKEELTNKEWDRLEYFYKTLGIEMDRSVLAHMNTGRKAASFLRGAGGRGLLGVLNRVVTSGFSPYSTGEQHEGSTLKVLAKLQAEITTDLYASSTTGAKGNKKHGITYQSHISNILHALQSKKEAGLALLHRLNKDPYYKGSYLLELFGRSMVDGRVKFDFEDFIERFDFRTHESTNISGEVKEYTDLNPSDRLINDLELFLGLDATGKDKGWSWFMMPTPGEKGNTRILKLPRLTTKNQAVQILRRQALSEYNRIVQVMRELDPNDPLYIKPHKQIEGYHFILDKNGNRQDGAGLKFSQFAELEEVLMKNGKLLKWEPNANKVKLAIEMSLENEIVDYANLLKAKDGYGIIYGEKGKKGRTNTKLNYNSVKEYTDEETGNIDVYGLATDFVMNSLVWNNEMIKILQGDPAYYQNIDKFSKRSFEVISAGRRARVAKYGVKPSVRSLIIKEPKKGDISVADAQGYITLDYYVRYLKGLGEFSRAHERALEGIKKGKVAPKDTALLLKPLKFFTYELQSIKGKMVPLQIKHSVVPLHPLLTGNDSKLAKLNNFMMANNIDEVNFNDTGIKIGGRSVIESFEALDTLENLEDHVVEFSNSGRMLVTETDAKDEYPRLGSQIRKLIFGNVKDDSNYEVNGEILTGAELKDQLHTTINEILEQSSAEVERLINNPESLKRVVMQQFKKRGLPGNTEKLLTIENGKFKYPISFPSIIKKVENILNSLYRNNVTVTRIRGYNPVQVSSYGLAEDLKYVTNADGEREAEIAVSEKLFDQYGSFEAIEQAFKEGVIYRIPTQSKASMVAVKVKRLIPRTSGDIILLPVEIVNQMGSDFDIDKVFVMLRDKYAPKGSKAEKNNKIIDLMRAVLTSPIHFNEVTNPIHNETLKAKRDEVVKHNNTFAERKIGSPVTQFELFVSNISGKLLIGRFARHVQHHPVTSTVPYILSAPISVNGEIVTQLDGSEDVKVADALQQLLNISVDNLNDPIGGELNINLVTAEVIALYVRAGLDLGTAVDFINHPAIQSFVKNFYKTGSVNKAINIAAIELGVSEEYKLQREETKREVLPNIDSKIVNSNDKGDIAQVLRSFYRALPVTRRLGKDISNLGFDGSKSVGATLYEKEAFQDAMDGVGLEEGAVNNVKNQATGFKQYQGFYKYGVEDALRVIGAIIPTSKASFKALHKALGISKAKSYVKESVTFAFMTHTLTLPESPLKDVFNRENRFRLLSKKGGSLWDRVEKHKEIYGEGANLLLQYLEHEEVSGLDFLLFNNKAHWTADEMTDLSQAWLELFYLDTDLARDLAEYSLITTGFSFSPYSMMQLIPAEYWTESQFAYKNDVKDKMPPVEYWRAVESKLASPQFPNMQSFLPAFVENFGTYRVSSDFIPDFTEIYNAEKSLSMEGKDGYHTVVNDIIGKVDGKGGEELPLSIKLTKEQLNKFKDLLKPQYATVSVPFTNAEGVVTSKSRLLRYEGITSDGLYVFNLSPTKGLEYRFQEWNEGSILPDNELRNEYAEDWFWPVEQYSVAEYDDLLEQPSLDDETDVVNNDSIDLSIDPSVSTKKESDFVSESKLKALKDKLDTQQLQISSKEYDLANEKLDNELKKFLSRFGVRVEHVDNLKTRMGSDALAVYRVIEKIIKVSNGEAKIDTLPEESAHFFVDFLGVDSPLIQKMFYDVQTTGTYMEVVKEYGEEYEGDELKMIKEAVGKVIAMHIVGEFRRREANKTLAAKIARTIEYIINRIKSFFSKIPVGQMKEEIDPFRLSAQMILDNNLGLSEEAPFNKLHRRGRDAVRDILLRSDLITAPTDETEFAQLAKPKKEEVKKHRPLNVIVGDPTLSQATKINAILENALDILIKKEAGLKKHSKSKESGKIEDATAQRMSLEKMIEQGMGAKALSSFVEQSSYIITNAYARAMEMVETGPDTILTGRTPAEELNKLYTIASSWGFIDQVLTMAMKEDSDPRIKKLLPLIQKLKSEKDQILIIHDTVGKPIIARFLSEVGSAFMTEEEILAELEMGTKDISKIDRWVKAMSQVSDPILQLVDKAVRVAKGEARFLTRKYNESLAKAVENHKKGYTGNIDDLYKDYVEYHEGVPTGYFVSEWTAEYYSKRDKAVALMSEAYDVEEEGNVGKATELRAKAQEIFDDIEPIDASSTALEETRTINPKYKNERYEEVKKQPMFAELMKGMATAVRMLPANRQSMMDIRHNRVRIPAVKKSFLESFKDKGFDAIELSKAFKSHSDDRQFGMLDENNQPIGEMPVYFTGKIDPKDLSLDLASNVSMFHNMARNVLATEKILHQLELTKDVMRNREVQVVSGMKVLKQTFGRNSEKVQTIKGGNAFELLDDYIKANIYGERKVKNGNIILFGWDSGWDQQKTAGTFLKYNAITLLSTNIFAAVANPIVGGTLQQIEAFSGQFFKTGAYAKATALYASQMPEMTGDLITGKNRSKINVLVELFDAIQEYATFETGVKEVSTKYKGIFNGPSIMGLQQMGEHWIQSRLAVSMLLSKTHKTEKVDGRTIHKFVDIQEGDTSLYDQLEVKNGEVFLNGKNVNDIEGIMKPILDLHLNILAINQRIHGNYTDIDRSAAHRTIIGQFVFQFRNWMVSGYDRRWGEARNDERLQTTVEGNYVTAGKFIFKLSKELREGQFDLVASWDKLDKTQKANIRRTLGEIVTIIALYVLLQAVFAGGAMDEDDEGAWAYNFTAYQVNRLFTELLFYSDPRETTKLLKSPAAAVNQVEKIMSLIGMVFKPTERYKSGSRRGELKLSKRASEIVPFWRDFGRAQHPGDLLQFFNN